VKKFPSDLLIFFPSTASARHAASISRTFGRLVARRRLRFGRFRLMMRKHQILTTKMKVEAGAQQFHAHGAALNMPAGPAFAQGLGQNTSPSSTARDFHNAKSAALPFILVAAHALAHAHLFEIQLNQLAILTTAGAIFFDAEID